MADCAEIATSDQESRLEIVKGSLETGTESDQNGDRDERSGTMTIGLSMVLLHRNTATQ